MKRPTLVIISVFAFLTIVALLIASKEMAPVGSLQSTTNPISNLLGGNSSNLPIIATAMPEFQGITKWWNTSDGQPLTPEKLKGKVVLIDFWTYSCINCIRTYPFLKTMYQRYGDKGLVIVGVHTPEFAFEKDPTNVEREIKKNGLLYPIALDPDYGTWNAYSNQYWPAEYLFDAQGKLRHTHFGEGEYDQSEQAIRSLLAEANADLQPMGDAVQTPDLSKIRTGETYFGLGRGNAFMGTPGIEGSDSDYTISSSVSSDRWSLGGTWQFKQEYIQADSANDIFRFNVQADELHIVMESADGKDKRIEISIDGSNPTTMTINASTLYNIANFPDAKRHTVQIKILDPGVRLYAATFS